MLPTNGHAQTAVIEPGGTDTEIGVGTLWRRRELVTMLASRSIRTRFRGTRLGIVWAFAQPLLYMLVMNAFFGLISRFNTGEIPYPLFLLTGLVVFQLVVKSISDGSGAIVGNQAILEKIYVPPIVFPAASILSSLIDFLFPATLIVLFLLYYGVAPSWNLLQLPLALMLLLVMCVAAQLFMSAMSLRFADVKMSVPLIGQLLFFATPIFYPIHIIPEKYRVIYGLINPMAGIVEYVRWCVLGLKQPPDIHLVLSSTASALAFLGISIVIFRMIARQLHRYL